MDTKIDVTDFDEGVEKLIKAYKTKNLTPEDNLKKKKFIFTNEKHVVMKTRTDVADAKFICIFSNNIPEPENMPDPCINKKVKVILKDKGDLCYFDVIYSSGKPYEFSDLYSFNDFDSSLAKFVKKIIIYFPFAKVDLK